MPVHTCSRRRLAAHLAPELAVFVTGWGLGAGHDVGAGYFGFGDWVIASREDSHSKTAIEINREPAAVPLELIQAGVCVACIARAISPAAKAGVGATAARPGDSDLLAFARVSLGDQSAKAKISRKIVAGQP
jgi:hypothetical protein